MMAAKKRAKKTLKLDVTSTDPKHWNKWLVDQGLSMERGSAPIYWINRKTPAAKRIRKTFSGGSLAELDRASERNYGKKLGKVSPTGHGPDG